MNTGPPLPFDRDALLRHRARAARMEGDTFLLAEARSGLTDRLAAVNRQFVQGVDLEGRAGFPHGVAAWTNAPLGEHEALAVAPGSADLVVSALGLHAVNDLPGVLSQIRRALKPDGLFLAALFGGETLFELRDSFATAEIETAGGISPRVAPFADVRDLGSLLQR